MNLDTFELGRFLLEREFDINVINSERSEYSSIINLFNFPYFHQSLVDLVTSFISDIESPSKMEEAKNIYCRLLEHNLLPANYPHESIFLVHIVCTDTSLAIDYVNFLLRRRESWPDKFIDNALDKMTTQLNWAIIRNDIKMVKQICSLVGPNGVPELNHYFTFYPFHRIREKVEKKYNHENIDERGFPPPLPRLERQLTNYGDERIFKAYKKLSKFLNMRIPLVLASNISKQMFDYMVNVGADISVPDEITGETVKS
jgi:hypothetical protein